MAPSGISTRVIIPTYNRADAGLDVARALVAQLGPGDGITVVWQGSGRPPDSGSNAIQVIPSNPPHLPRARNVGLRSTRSEIVLFLDDDVAAAPGLLDAHRRAYDDGSVGAVAGFVDDPLSVVPQSAPAWYDEKTGEFRQYYMCDRSQESVSAMGANMSFRRAAIEAAGGFDERLTRNALWEDADAAFRVRKAGWKIWYCAEARVKHNRVPTGGCRSDRGLRYAYHEFANTARFVRRHADPKSRASQLRYWWYRLEYLSRKAGRWPRHDPLYVAAAVLGWVAGTARPGRLVRIAGSSALRGA